MSLEIEHQRERQRFLAVIEGHDCIIDYRLANGVMTITHTWVPAEVGGRGIAGELTRFALATARAEGWKVEAECSYALRYLERHPDERVA